MNEAAAPVKGIYPEFHMDAVQDMEASEKAGRPIFKDEEFVTIRIAGDKDNDVVRPVRAEDKRMWPQQYAQFKSGQEQVVVGTPLDQIPFLTKAQRLEFAAVGIKTAEHIRDMPDSTAQRFMGIVSIKKRVADFLEAAAGAAPAIALRGELEKRDNEIAVLKQALDEQGKKIEDLLKHKKG
jgi:hypothetical protein